VIAISKITLGANPLSDQCPLYYDSSYDFNVCCTNGAGTDCLFPFYGKNNVYHELCNGKPACSTQTQHQQFDNSMCNVSLYGAAEGAFSNYMFMQYYCIEGTCTVFLIHFSSMSVFFQISHLRTYRNCSNYIVLSEMLLTHVELGGWTYRCTSFVKGVLRMILELKQNCFEIDFCIWWWCCCCGCLRW
jgi:hypothetical protein